MVINLSDRKVGDYIWNHKYMSYTRILRIEDGMIHTASTIITMEGRFTMGTGYQAFFNNHKECMDYIQFKAESWESIRTNPFIPKTYFEQMKKSLEDVDLAKKEIRGHWSDPESLKADNE